MAQSKLHGIRLSARGELIHERFMRERILQTCRRPKRTGPEGASQVVDQYALADDGARAPNLASKSPRHIRRDAVAVVIEIRINGSGDVSGHDVYPAWILNCAKLAYSSTGAWLKPPQR